MTFEYKMIQVPPTIQVKAKEEKGNEAAYYLESLANKWAIQGWEFYRVDTVGVVTQPGCLASLFGSKQTLIEYYVVTFRRETQNQKDQVRLSHGVVQVARLDHLKYQSCGRLSASINSLLPSLAMVVVRPHRAVARTYLSLDAAAADVCIAYPGMSVGRAVFSQIIHDQGRTTADIFSATIKAHVEDNRVSLLA